MAEKPIYFDGWTSSHSIVIVILFSMEFTTNHLITNYYDFFKDESLKLICDVWINIKIGGNE